MQVIAPAVVIDRGKMSSKVKSLVAMVTFQRLKSYNSVSTYTFGNVNQNKNDNQEAKARHQPCILTKEHDRIRLNERKAIGWVLNEDAKQNPNLENEPKQTPNLEMNIHQSRPGTIEADADIHVENVAKYRDLIIDSKNLEFLEIFNAKIHFLLANLSTFKERERERSISQQSHVKKRLKMRSFKRLSVTRVRTSLN